MRPHPAGAMWRGPRGWHRRGVAAAEYAILCAAAVLAVALLVGILGGAVESAFLRATTTVRDTLDRLTGGAAGTTPPAAQGAAWMAPRGPAGPHHDGATGTGRFDPSPTASV